MLTNEILGYAVIGCGRVSKRHIVAVNSIADATLRVLCDSDIKKAETLAKEFPGVQIESDYQKLLSRKDVQVVVICLPTFLHEKAAIDAAKSGKHIFMEKPITLTVEAAKNIIDACVKHNVKLYVGHSCRYLPEMKLARKIIKEGKLGKIFKARAINCGFVDYSQDERNWKRNPEKDYGVILNIGIHNADNLRYLLENEPVSVFAHTMIVRDDEVSLPDNGVALIQFEDDISVIWEVSESQFNLTDETRFPQGVSLEIYGTKGVLKINLAGKIDGYLIDKKGNEVIIEEESDVFYEIWEEMHKDFIENIKRNTNPLISGEEGMKSLALISGILESGRRKEFIKL
jgi:predicted dehydrogenase